VILTSQVGWCVCLECHVLEPPAWPFELDNTDNRSAQNLQPSMAQAGCPTNNAKDARLAQPLGFAFEMEPQFLAQIGFTAIAEEEGSQPAPESVPESHGQVLCRTRSTPAERRSHFETSMASCLRPAFVSE
jgi:hypothetical protein